MVFVKEPWFAQTSGHRVRTGHDRAIMVTGTRSHVTLGLWKTFGYGEIVPNDDMVLETGVNGQADAIVTFNERAFNPVAARFGCRVMRPGEFLRLLAGELG